MEYDRIKCVTNPHAKNRHLILPQAVTLHEFIPNLKVLLAEFVWHVAAKKMQNHKRDVLTKVMNIGGNITYS